MDGCADEFLERLDAWRGMAIKWGFRKWGHLGISLEDLEDCWGEALEAVWRAYPALVRADREDFEGVGGFVLGVMRRAVVVIRHKRRHERGCGGYHRVDWGEEWWRLWFRSPELIASEYVDVSAWVIAVLPLLPVESRRRFRLVMDLVTAGAFSYLKLGDELNCSVRQARDALRVVRRDLVRVGAVRIVKGRFLGSRQVKRFELQEVAA